MDDIEGVERRREPRYRFSQPVRLTLFGGAEQEAQVLHGMILDRSGRGMRISTPSFVEPGTPIRLDLRNEVVLAEVCYCQPLHGRFALGLELLPSLKNLDDLSQLGRALTGRPGAPAPRSAA